MHTCMIITLAILIASTIEACNIWDVILDNNQVINIRVKYIVRLIFLIVLLGMSLLLIFDWFGVTSEVLSNYLRHGKAS